MSALRAFWVFCSCSSTIISALRALRHKVAFCFYRNSGATRLSVPLKISFATKISALRTFLILMIICLFLAAWRRYYGRKVVSNDNISRIAAAL